MLGIGDFAPKNGRIGPFASEIERERAEIGDVVQLANSRGVFYHSLIISGFRNGEILISAQSNDALDRPLSTYNYARARFLHIEGVNVELEERDAIFLTLLRGEELPPANVIFKASEEL